MPPEYKTQHELLVNAYITMSCKKINFIEAKLLLKKPYITVLLNYGGLLCKLFMVPMMNVTKIFIIRIMFLMLVRYVLKSRETKASNYVKFDNSRIIFYNM